MRKWESVISAANLTFQQGPGNGVGAKGPWKLGMKLRLPLLLSAAPMPACAVRESWRKGDHRMEVTALKGRDENAKSLPPLHRGL